MRLLLFLQWGCSTAYGTSLFPSASPNFLLLKPDTQKDKQVVYRCVSPLRAAAIQAGGTVPGWLGPEGQSISLQVSVGLGPWWVRAGFPFAFHIPSCSHLLWPAPLRPFIFPNFLSTPHFATLSSVLSPTSCSLLLLSGLQPSTSLLGPAVCGVPCPLPRLWSQALCPLGSRLVSTQIPTGIAKTAALH